MNFDKQHYIYHDVMSSWRSVQMSVKIEQRCPENQSTYLIVLVIS